VPHHSRPHHSKPHLTAPIHDCLTTYHRTFSIQSPPIHYCPTPPDLSSIGPVLCTFPALPFRSLPSRSRPFRSSATFLPYHTVNNHSRPILDCQIIPRRTAKIHYEPFHGCLIAPHHASRIQSLPLLPYRTSPEQTAPIPLQTSCLTTTYRTHPSRSLTASPERTSPFLIATFPALTAQPSLAKRNLS
jgi:hypothetical protein